MDKLKLGQYRKNGDVEYSRPHIINTDHVIFFVNGNHNGYKTDTKL
jgi:hypothetical protein